MSGRAYIERVIASRPADRTAARVTSAGPRGMESSKVIAQVLSATPLPTRPVPVDAPNLVGAKCGRLTVVGLAIKKAHDHALWVCRCVCGYYVTRSAKAVRNPNNRADCCDRCRQVDFLRRRSTWQQTGIDQNDGSAS